MNRLAVAQTYRLRVLAVIQEANGPLTSQQIAASTGLTYKQTVDALNALNNASKIARIGRKYTARWCRIEAAENTAITLEKAFRGFFR